MSEHIMKACRRASVPLLGIETVDPASTIKGCLDALNGKLEQIPLVEWDICRGLKAMNKAGERAIEWYDPLAQQLPDILRLFAENPVRGTVLFLHQASRFLERDGVSQGLWLLRDTWKAETCTAVLLGPTVKLPSELVQDVVVTSEALPDAAGMGAIIDKVMESARNSGAEVLLEPADKAKACDTLLGLSAFAAEQTVAMCTRKTGLDHNDLWERKRRLVEQTPGLEVWRGEETFESLGGLVNLKAHLTSLLTSGRNPVRCIGFIDEVEKSGVASGKGDLSGVSTDQLGVVLKAMQDDNIPGILLLGPPGTGKSAIAKASGGVAKAEVLSMDFGAMKGGIVGESEAKVRAAMATFKAVAQGKGLFIATCNAIGQLPPELRRRFTLGTFFVDLPSKEERALIWQIWLRRYGLDTAAMAESAGDLPDDEGWTGAEIKACVDTAFRCGYSLVKAAEYVTPVCRSAPDTIKGLREMASGKFISASVSGIYSMDEGKKAKDGFRKLSLG